MPRNAARQRNLHVPASGTAASLPRFTSTSLAVDIGTVTREVLKRGAAIITRHDEPVMVLVSMDRYAEMERASSPDLAALTSRFDDLYARMQTPGVAERTIAALDLGARTATRKEVASAPGAGKSTSRKVTAKPRKILPRRRA